ncbi:MAG: diacylglycerol kinase family lipid kinase [Chitinophagaceae bacterium]|nr:diacylglycerol kinase family lipid kinase [Chitinophagaceae bacterium]
MSGNSKILFIVNPGSGNSKTDWPKEIDSFFAGKQIEIEQFELPNPCEPSMLKDHIVKSGASKVVAVGGDGTIKLVAEQLPNKSIPLGILPAGSANGMAKELGIPATPAEALLILLEGELREIHLVQVNKEICIHLSDVGFNAFVVKKFEDDKVRGMWGYFKAAWKVLWTHSRMTVNIKTDDETILREAVMVVIANATMYGNGVVINPSGSLYDNAFEVVLIKQISLKEILKMRFTRKDPDPGKTEIFQTSSLQIKSKQKMHFQVDGEYRGKVKEVTADISNVRLTVICPTTKK